MTAPAPNLAELVQYVLDTHHALLHHELPRLDIALADAPPELQQAWRALSMVLHPHLQKEERMLFPAIVAAGFGDAHAGCGVPGPVRQMSYEHDEIRRLEQRVREAAHLAGEHATALIVLLDDLSVHAELEDDRLFPLALAAMTANDSPDLTQVGRAPEKGAEGMGLRELCQTVFEDHGRIRVALDQAFATVESPAAARLSSRLRAHFAVEEATLYPALMALGDGREPRQRRWLSLLHELPDEVEVTHAWVAELLDAADGGPVDPAVQRLLEAVVAHAAFEVEWILPVALKAAEVFGADEPAAVAPAAVEPAAVEPAAVAPAAVAPAAVEPAAVEPAADEQVLRRTRGRCSTCLVDVPAQVVVTPAAVRLDKHCPEHGLTSEHLSAEPAYWAELDSYYFAVNGQEWPQRDFFVRMTESCNLDCPICLAKANTEDTPDMDLSGLETLLTERRGIKVDLLAAEPTLRDDLLEWVARVKAAGSIAALHTNGIKLADPAYCASLAAAGVDEVFLQFDGFDDDAHMALRGARLLKRRLRALENLRNNGIATSLIVVIARDLNEDQVGQVYRFALRPENDHIREVFFLGLRVLGSTRYAQAQGEGEGECLAGRALMPDALITLLCDQVPELQRDDIRRFNKLYFALLSAFQVRKCLYVQHYLVSRDRMGKATPVCDLLPLDRIEIACDAYAQRLPKHPNRARARLLADLARLGVRRETLGMIFDLAQLQLLFRRGMNLRQVPRRFLLLGFITACDPQNFDAQVAVNCGKGELSVDGGFIDNGAKANIEREARFDQTDKVPGSKRR